MHDRAAKAYRSAIASSSSSLHTLLFLYDMMIAHLLRARDGQERGQLDTCFCALRDASRIALALPTTLDRARAGRLGPILERFYLALSYRIIRLSRRGQALAQFDRVIDELRSVRATWQEVSRLTSGRVDIASTVADRPDGSFKAVNG
ncbi:MAG TPA: flagellar protein FliS [Dongiaceae bacterium]|jgi:flagellin-specific chaperone FliS|nr:flagellar protein FliS [Dongiaceae bacterium]